MTPTRSARSGKTVSDALAGLGGNIVCKLSGLAMPLGSMRVAVLGPWLEYAIEAFGADRCMFASNFPVDSMAGSFDELYTTFDSVTSGLSDAAREVALFAGTAERIYRLWSASDGVMEALSPLQYALLFSK